METTTESAPKNALRGVKVTYSDGSVIATNMAAHLTNKEIYDYYRYGTMFNLGTGGADNMQYVVNAEILPDETPEPEKPILAHLLPLAQRAYYWTSHNPEKHGESTVNDYSAELSTDIESIRTAAAKNSDIDQEQINAAIERYKAKYTQHLSAYLHSHSNVASTFITGGSGFPVRRQEKLHRWADNKYEFFREYRTRALKAIIKSFKKVVTSEGLIEGYKTELASRLKRQERNKELNKIIRAHKGNREAIFKTLTETGMSAGNAIILMKPDYLGRIGVPRFDLTNNLANIKRLQGRIKELEGKAMLAEMVGTRSKMFGEVEAVKNYEQDRFQLKYPGKPPYETISKLKKNGFRWSPSNMAWQRYLSNFKWATMEVLNVQIADLDF